MRIYPAKPQTVERVYQQVDTKPGYGSGAVVLS